MGKKSGSKVVKINWIDQSERCAVVPSQTGNRISPRLKELKKVKGNCYFTSGVAHSMIDFIYRSVIRLGIGEKRLIFSRGSVKRNGRPVFNAVNIHELDWDVGISVIIPQRLNYNKKIRLLINGHEQSLRLMEIIVLAGLLRVTTRGKPYRWYNEMAATIIAMGWKELESGVPAVVLM